MVGSPADMSKAEELFLKLDQNSDGYISQEEFITIIKQDHNLLNVLQKTAWTEQVIWEAQLWFFLPKRLHCRCFHQQFDKIALESLVRNRHVQCKWHIGDFKYLFLNIETVLFVCVVGRADYIFSSSPPCCSACAESGFLKNFYRYFLESSVIFVDMIVLDPDFLLPFFSVPL